MHIGGYNPIKPEHIHPTADERDKALQLIRTAQLQDIRIFRKVFDARDDLVAHMVASAHASLYEAPSKQTFAMLEPENETNCYLLLAQQLGGRVVSDLYFPDPVLGGQMIKAFTGVEVPLEQL